MEQEYTEKGPKAIRECITELEQSMTECKNVDSLEMAKKALQRCKSKYGENLERIDFASDKEIEEIYQMIEQLLVMMKKPKEKEKPGESKMLDYLKKNGVNPETAIPNPEDMLEIPDTNGIFGNRNISVEHTGYNYEPNPEKMLDDEEDQR